MTIELRCKAKLHAIVYGGLSEEAIIEVACGSQFCGAGRGIVVRHRFRLQDQTIACETRRFKSPERRAHVRTSGADAAVRTS